MAAGLSALVFGGTGATGKHVLCEVLTSDRYSRVGEYGRSVTADAKLPTQRNALEQKVIDFERLESAGVKEGNWDIVLISLATRMTKSPSAAAFEKVDREYVLNAARAAKSDDPTRKQRLIYVSSFGANPQSRFLFPRSKGLTEQGLAALGYDDVIIFRPGYLARAERADASMLESAMGYVTGFLGKFTHSLEIPVSTLGKSIRIAGELGTEGIPDDIKSLQTVGGNPITVIYNAAAHKLASLQ